MPEMSVSAAGTVTKVKMTNKMVIIVFILPFMSFSSVSCHWGIGARSAAANSAAMHRRAGKYTKVVTAKNAVRIHSRIFSNKLPGVFLPAAAFLARSCWASDMSIVYFNTKFGEFNIFLSIFLWM